MMERKKKSLQNRTVTEGASPTNGGFPMHLFKKLVLDLCFLEYL